MTTLNQGDNWLHLTDYRDKSLGDCWVSNNKCLTFDFDDETNIGILSPQSTLDIYEKKERF